MEFSTLLITRPRPEAEDLAARVAGLGLNIVVMPAHDFVARTIQPAELDGLSHAAASGTRPLLVFTSRRAVEFGLPQIPQGILPESLIAAIGPATAEALREHGQADVLVPAHGYTSEALLETLAGQLPEAGQPAWIFAAAGGRRALEQGLAAMGMECRMALVYERLEGDPDPHALKALQAPGRILSVWTSSNAMDLMSRIIPAPTWERVCGGVWLCISARLAEEAGRFCPAGVHVTDGPGNAAVAGVVQKLCSRS